MTEILKFFFDRITDPLGLPINALYEHLIIVVISQFAFRCAYRFIGDLYSGGYISGGKRIDTTLGSPRPVLLCLLGNYIWRNNGCQMDYCK